MIGLVAAVLTPFVLRPLLSLGIKEHPAFPVKATLQPCPAPHHSCGLARQLESQTRESDSKSQKPLDSHSKASPAKDPSRVAAGMEMDSPPLLSKSNHSPYPFFLRI